MAKSILETREDLLHGRIKEHDKDTQLACTQTSAVSKQIWDEVKFIDRDPHCYHRRVKEAIHIRLHANNINRDSGIEIPEGWMPTMKQHKSPSLPQRTREGTAFSQNNGDRNPPIINNHSKDRNAPIKNSQGAAYNETQPIDMIA